MKKRNLLRTSGILVILAVLGLLSTCDNFIPHNPEPGGSLTFDFDTDEPFELTKGTGGIFTVTVKITGKINEENITWSLEPSDVVLVTVINTRDNSLFESGDKAVSTNLIFTVAPLKAGTTTLTISFYGEDYEVEIKVS
jgi:hypothetical protein